MTMEPPTVSWNSHPLSRSFLAFLDSERQPRYWSRSSRYRPPVQTLCAVPPLERITARREKDEPFRWLTINHLFVLYIVYCMLYIEIVYIVLYTTRVLHPWKRIQGFELKTTRVSYDSSMTFRHLFLFSSGAPSVGLPLYHGTETLWGQLVTRVSKSSSMGWDPGNIEGSCGMQVALFQATTTFGILGIFP